MKPRSACPLALGLLLAGGCSTPHIWTQQRIGPLNVSGDLAVSAGGGGASSSVEGLGFEKDKSVWSPRVDFDWGSAHLAATYFDSSHSGDGFAESQLDLGTGTIMVGDPVTSQFDVELLSAALTFDFIPGDFLDVALGLGGGSIDWNASITSGANSVVSSESFPIGFLAGRVASRIDNFLIYVDVGALEISIDSDKIRYLDVDGGLAWRFWEFGPAYCELSGGYRVLQAKLEYDEQGGQVDADLEFDGFYLGLSIGL